MASFSNFKSTIVEASNTAAGITAGVTVYATRANLPTSANAGDQAYVTENNRLYIWNGNGWYNIALINLAPSIQSVLDSDGGTTPFILAIDGTATTITITATDSDGDPITYTAEADSDFSGLASISQESNVFTVTPLSQDSASTQSGTITFKADDGVNIASSINIFTLNFISEYWDETVLSIGTSSTNGIANSTFVDRSTNAHTVTPTGTPTQTAFHPYLDNWSVEFDGSGDYLDITDNGDLDFGTSAFTIEAWIYSATGLTTSNRTIVDTRPVGAAATGDYYFFVNSSAKLVLGTQKDSDPTPGFNVASTASLNPNQWTHVVAARDGNTLRLFINGALDSSHDVTGKTYNAAIFRIGNGTATGTSLTFWNGYLGSLRCVKGTAVYTSAFTPSTSPLTVISGTSLLTCQSNRFIDNSSNAHVITPAGNVKISAFNPFGQGSEYAVGENKGSVFANSGVLSSSITAIGTSDFTLELWVYFTGATTGIVFDSRSSGVATDGFAFYRNSSGALSVFTGSLYSGSTTLLNNQWYHLVVSRSSGVFRTFVNGVQERADTISTNFSRATSKILAQYDDNNKLIGYVSDLKLIVGTALYTTNFTPPTAPVGNTNASLYLPFDNAGIFDKTGLNTLTPVGNASTSTTQTKFDDTAMYFDGSGDFIEISDSNAVEIGSSNFTIECWVYFNSHVAGSAIVSKGLNGPFLIYLGNFELAFYSSANGSGWTVSDLRILNSFVPAASWNHVAVTRNGNEFRTFWNGGLVSTITSSHSLVNNSSPVRIGEYSGKSINGYIENLQILKGVAKYTTNFTPPNRTQGRTYQAES